MRFILAVILLSLGANPAFAKERTYYIAADEVVWDYAPSAPVNPITGLPFTDTERDYIEKRPTRIGSSYIKAVYHAYTDKTFAAQKPRAPEDAYLGILGPIIHAEVGDTITVVFRNNTRIPVGIHPHGVRYDKEFEGAHYMIGSTAAPTNGVKANGVITDSGAHIAPGREYTYHWTVPEESGPGPADPDSVVWLYHAHDHESVDIFTGLIGAIIITRAGHAKPDGTPRDVDREFIALFMIFDENLSPLLNANIRRFAEAPLAVKPWDEGFKESNKKHAINGYIFGNLDGLTMRKNQRVRWYLIGLGNENDIHSAHWHGNTVLHRGQRTDTIGLLPATTEVVDMKPGNVGTWMFHCHVADHMAAGMMTRYAVTE